MSDEKRMLPIPVTVTASNLKYIPPNVKPIEITKNGVYDATVGGLKYGETVKLKENIDATAFERLLVRLAELDFPGIATMMQVAYPLLVIGNTDLSSVAIYIHNENAAAFYTENFGTQLTEEHIGHWVDLAGNIVTDFSVTFFTEEECAELESLGVSGDDLAIFMDCYAGGDTDGYNPVTVKVPNGYGTEDATASASDIIEGKTAYVNGEKLTGTHADTTGIPIYPEDLPLGLTAVVNGKKIEGTQLVPSGTLIYGGSVETTLSFPSDVYTSVEDGEITAGATYNKKAGVNLTVMTYNTYALSSLAGLPRFTSRISAYQLIEEVKDLDMRSCRTASYKFDCGSGLPTTLKKVSLKHTENVTTTASMFSYCTSLAGVKGIDMRNVTNVYHMFHNCKALTELELKNISYALQVGSGSTYGHLLTPDSLVGLLRELRNTDNTKTLTIGSTNLGKLNFYYPYNEQYPQDNQPLRVKLIEITDEMRAEDEFIDEKLPFEICTQAEAWGTSNNSEYMTYAQYLTLKKWKVQ